MPPLKKGLSCSLLLVGSARGNLQQEIREKDEVVILSVLASLCSITLDWLQPLSLCFILLAEGCFCSVPVATLSLAPCLYKHSFLLKLLESSFCDVPLFPARTLTDTDGNRKPFRGSDI